MYSRAVLGLCAGGRGVTAAAIRFRDHLARRAFTIGSVHCSEKTPPDNNGTATPPAEKEADAPSQKDSSHPPKKDNLLNLLSGMKVGVSSKKKFQDMKKKKMEEKKKMGEQQLERMERIESASQMFQMASHGGQLEEEEAVGPELEAAASAVASRYPDKQNQVESELLQQLRQHKQMAQAQRRGDVNLRDVISGMKVLKQPQKPSRNMQHGDAQEQEVMRLLKKSSQGLFSGKRLKIFPVPSVSEQTELTEHSLNLWDIELAKEIAAIYDHPPRNGFEEMIQWTKEGKLWTFPIDNEAGLHEEQNVEFHEHIFLEKYLEDFPRHESILHFMELVVCGLSKNPFLTVQQKKEHIDWFRNYFNQKEDILQECEAYNN